MPHPIGTLDEFGRSPAQPDGTPWPRRLIFAQDTAPPTLGSLQVQFPRLELVIEGHYRNEISTTSAAVETIDLAADDCLVIPSNSWNHPVWDRDVKVLSLLFGATHLGASLMAWSSVSRSFTSVEKRSCLIPGNGPLHLMVEAVCALREEGISEGPHGRLLAQSILEYARRLIAHPIRDEEPRSSAFYRAACLYIDENYDKVITRESLARHLKISPNYFSRVFREQGVSTFSDYLTQVRIGKAKFMLEKYDLPLAQISQRCGFNDFNYFLKVFKKVVGRTPTEYRNSLKSKAG
jgi:AraC-like DNA-binding protein